MHEEIDRLKSRLQWESGGPLAHLADQAVDAIASRAKALAAWVRERAEERPLVSLLVRFPAGFRRRSMGAAPCEALIFSRSRSTPNCCGCAR